MTFLPIEQLEKYVNVIIPKIEHDMPLEENPKKKLELYKLYVEILRLCAKDDFICFNKFLELDEPRDVNQKSFYYHRKDHSGIIFEAMNDMEIYDKYDILLVIAPPRIGKTTTGIRFLSWICGRYPEESQLATSYSDNITTSFYIGVMECISSDRYKEVFPDAPVVNQNAKREEIWLKTTRRYPTITFVPINGSMAGRCETSRYLYCDDLVSGFEEALSITRMEKLWNLYAVNARQRKLKNAKEIHIATPWSVHDVISTLRRQNEKNPRCKIIHIPCLNEDGESNFDHFDGFDTKYYKDIRNTMDKCSFEALYMGNPIEREGLLYHPEDLQYYFKLPNDRPDSIIAICDSKNLGNDYVASIVGYVYGNTVYVEDVVYNDGLPEVTRPLVANMWLRNKVIRADVELNNGGNYYAEDLNELVKKSNGKTSVRIFYSGNNKMTKIITYSDYVKLNFVFKHESTYKPKSEYGMFMRDIFSWTQTGKNKHDDAPDALAMLAQLAQELQGQSVKFLDRKALKI